MSNQQCKYCPPDGECVCPPEWCHCDPDGIAICAGHVKEREAQLRKELKAANKGAQTNALVNQSLSKQLWELREKLAAAEKLLREAVEPGVFGIQDRSRISAPEDEMIRELGLQIGFGALMDSASRMWAIVAEQDGHPGSEFIVSACAATQKRWVAQVEELLAIIDGNDVLKEGM